MLFFVFFPPPFFFDTVVFLFVPWHYLLAMCFARYIHSSTANIRTFLFCPHLFDRSFEFFGFSSLPFRPSFFLFMNRRIPYDFSIRGQTWIQKVTIWRAYLSKLPFDYISAVRLCVSLSHDCHYASFHLSPLTFVRIPFIFARRPLLSLSARIQLDRTNRKWMINTFSNTFNDFVLSGSFFLFRYWPTMHSLFFVAVLSLHSKLNTNHSFFTTFLINLLFFFY